MTNEEINKAIAEVCGWKFVKCDCGMCGESYWRHPSTDLTEFPNYCGDLNAMHEAENTMDEQSSYRVFVGYLVNELKPGEFAVRATAIQRAKAFLRMKGKLKDA